MSCNFFFKRKKDHFVLRQSFFYVILKKQPNIRIIVINTVNIIIVQLYQGITHKIQKSKVILGIEMNKNRQNSKQDTVYHHSRKHGSTCRLSQQVKTFVLNNVLAYIQKYFFKSLLQIEAISK